MLEITLHLLIFWYTELYNGATGLEGTAGEYNCFLVNKEKLARLGPINLVQDQSSMEGTYCSKVRG